MGRTPICRRGYQHHGEGEVPNTPESPDKPAFPRRFPRLGIQFQTKIPKSNEPLERPPPESCSADYPHLTETEAKQETIEQNDAPVGSFGVSCRQGYEFPTSRGGLLVHKPSDDMDRFPHFVQPFMRPLEDPAPLHVTDDAWKQQMIHLHNQEADAPKKRGRAPRGAGQKRKRVEGEEELVWSLENMLQTRNKEEQCHPSAVLGEDDAFTFEHLYLRHGGNVEAAELNLLVDLSSGRASKVRKCIEKIRLKAKLKQPPSTTSDSWRTTYERMKAPSILGQLQDNVQINYGIKGLTASDYSDEMTDGMNLASDRDDLKGAWRSVLACGKSLERQLDGDTSGNKKPLLSTLVLFISHAYGLPIPESCFGTNHVMIEEVSTCLLKILDYIENARHFQAKLRDMLFDKAEEGIDADALQKYLDNEGKSIPVRLDEADSLYQSIEIVADWESRLSSVLEPKEGCIRSEDRDELRAVEEFEMEARNHGYISKSLVQLKVRIQKSYKLRNRIMQWKQSCDEGLKTSIKKVAALVREANRVDLMFPEVSNLFTFNRTMEGWIDRANIAIRSRISLVEIKALIRRGEEMPLDLSDYVVKLHDRVRTADEWIGYLSQEVPCPKTVTGEMDMLSWMGEMRKALLDGQHGRLHDLASEGSRIPVEVDAVKLLQVELDAKTWTLKANKWIPKNSDSRRGKLADIEDHVEKASYIREKLALTEKEKEAWILEGEADLISIVEAADTWFDKYKPFLDGDNRRNTQRSCLSIEKLRCIAEEGNSIHANIGNATSKITRILAQAESWHEEHKELLAKCKLNDATGNSPISFVELSELRTAVESAASDVSLDLDEAVALKDLMEKVEKWFDRVTIAAPKRSKRQGRTMRPKYTVDDLVALIEEASSLPVNTEEEVKRLQMQLSNIQTWRLQASHELEKIGFGFDQLRENVKLAYGLPNEFCLDSKFNEVSDDDESLSDNDENNEHDEKMDVEKSTESNKDLEDNCSQSDSASTAGSNGDGALTHSGKGDSNVHRMIREVQNGAKGNGVLTAEAEMADVLESVSSWCVRSMKYLSSPREIFDKRFFGAFDRFIKEGQDLHEKSKTSASDSDDDKFFKILGSSWGGLVSDQLDRLAILRSERGKFTEWCDLASQILSDEKKMTVEKLKEIADQSRSFPSVSDMVQKVRGLSVKVMKWAEKARKIFDSGEKLSMQDAKALLEAGEKLQVNTAELRTLKAAHRAARSWANRVKRCNLDQGEIHVNTVKELIKEQKSLLIEMPEEFDRLQNATQSYCICRRPYDGFMIGCDECEEWYHGPCIGVSESKAGRFETYQCMRCSVKNVFKSSASSAAGIIRKWTSRKDLKKARQVEYQKVQRKVRKETKDAEKFRKEIVALEAKLSGEKPAMEEPVDAKTVQSSDVVSANTPSLGEANESADEPKVETEENEQTKDESTETGSEIAAEAEAKVENMKVEDVEAKLEKAMTNLKQAEERLVDLAGKSADLKRIEQYENKYAEALRRWCIRVRSLVLVPSLEKQAEEARPLFKGALSQPMLSVMADASVLGISDMPDVDDMLNAFECMSWSMYTLSVIKRKPNFAEMNSIVEQGSTLTLPDEKALRTMKHMQQRALQWQGKIRKSLLPKPGSTKALSMDMLKELLSSVEDISVHIPEVNRLKVIIEDKGARHCVCGGPSDGQFMLCCDKCERWFHGSCMNLTKESSDDLKNWLCAPCAGNEQVPAPVPDESGTWNDCSGFSTAAESTEEHDVSLHAPEPSKLWPPFALLGSEKATESLGAGCAAIPDEMHSIRRPTEDNGPSKAVNENPEVRKENGAEILLPDAVSGKSSAGSNLAPPMNSMATRTSTRTSSSTCLSVKDNESTEQSKPFDVQPPSVVSNDSLVPSTTPQPAEEVVTLEASSTNRNLAEQAKVVTSTDPACKLISNECLPMEVDDSGEKSQRAPEFVTGQYQSQNKETPVVKSQEPHRVVDPKSASDNVCGPMEMDDSNEATSALDASESHSVVDGILSSKPSESEDRMVEEECSKNKTAEEECIKDKMVEEECSKDKAIEEECSKDKMVEEECNGAESGLMSGSSSTQGCEPYLNQKVTVTPSASDVKFSDIEQEAPLNTRDNRDTDSPMCHSTEIKENLPNTQALAQVLQEARV